MTEYWISDTYLSYRYHLHGFTDNIFHYVIIRFQIDYQY